MRCQLGVTYNVVRFVIPPRLGGEDRLRARAQDNRTRSLPTPKPLVFARWVIRSGTTCIKVI